MKGHDDNKLWEQLVKAHKPELRPRFTNEFRVEFDRVLSELRTKQGSEAEIGMASTDFSGALNEIKVLHDMALKLQRHIEGMSYIAKDMLCTADETIDLLPEEIFNRIKMYMPEKTRVIEAEVFLIKNAAIPLLSFLSWRGIDKIKTSRLTEQRVHIRCSIAYVIYKIDKLYSNFIEYHIGRLTFYKGMKSQAPTWLVTVVRSIVGVNVTENAVDEALKALNSGCDLSPAGHDEDIGDASWTDIFRAVAAADAAERQAEENRQRDERKQARIKRWRALHSVLRRWSESQIESVSVVPPEEDGVFGFEALDIRY